MRPRALIRLPRVLVPEEVRRSKISARNHYWDKKETPRFGEMMERYEHHMLFYQQLEESCELDFKIARRDHCD